MVCFVFNIVLLDGNEVIWSKVKVNWWGVIVVFFNYYVVKFLGNYKNLVFC